ncbi:MAG: hypothetical protein IT385_26725 [Deltaproteobacteria bacterium]|nr:hypothetical protein [Deltaproteobacteria bacterium]
MNKLLYYVGVSIALNATAPACGDDEGGGDTSTTNDASETSDAPDLTGKSAYTLLIDVDEDSYDLGLRDLTGETQYFAFGSTHIAPAVSFAMTDSLTFPRTINFTLDFGIVVPSEDRPIATEGVGTHALTAENPSITLFIKGLTYRSTNAGAAGQIVISDWSTETDGVVAGSYEATLVADGPTGKTASVSGIFHFILPSKESGQPQ